MLPAPTAVRRQKENAMGRDHWNRSDFRHAHIEPEPARRSPNASTVFRDRVRLFLGRMDQQDMQYP